MLSGALGRKDEHGVVLRLLKSFFLPFSFYARSSSNITEMVKVLGCAVFLHWIPLAASCLKARANAAWGGKWSNRSVLGWYSGANGKELDFRTGLLQRWDIR